MKCVMHKTAQRESHEKSGTTYDSPLQTPPLILTRRNNVRAASTPSAWTSVTPASTRDANNTPSAAATAPSPARPPPTEFRRAKPPPPLPTENRKGRGGEGDDVKPASKSLADVAHLLGERGDCAGFLPLPSPPGFQEEGGDRSRSRVVASATVVVSNPPSLRFESPPGNTSAAQTQKAKGGENGQEEEALEEVPVTAVDDQNGLPLPHRQRRARSASARGTTPGSPTGASATALGGTGPCCLGRDPQSVCERPEAGVPATSKSAPPPVTARSTRREAAVAYTCRQFEHVCCVPVTALYVAGVVLAWRPPALVRIRMYHGVLLWETCSILV